MKSLEDHRQLKGSHPRQPWSPRSLAVVLISLALALGSFTAYAASSDRRFSQQHADLSAGGVSASTTRFRVDAAFSELGGLAESTAPVVRLVTRTGPIGVLNDPPRAVGDTLRIRPTGSTAVTLHAHDREGDRVSFRIVTFPAHGTLSGTPPALDYTPNTSSPMDDAFEFVANDGFGDSSKARVVLQASPTSNQAPVLPSLPDRTVAEGYSLSFRIEAVDDDLPAQRLTYSLEGAVPAGVGMDPGNGQFTWAPAETHGPGIYRFTVVVTDDGSPARSARAEFRVTVAESQSSPRLLPIPDRSVDETTTLEFRIKAVDDDIPTQRLTYAFDGNIPDGATLEPATGAFRWTPSENLGPGTYRFGVVVTDDGSPSSSARTEFQVVVAEANEAPRIAPISAISVRAGEQLSLFVTAIDDDMPAQTLRYHLEEAPAGAQLDPVTGKFQWPTPSDAPSGTHFVTVAVEDDGVPALRARYRFGIRVEGAPRLSISKGADGTIRLEARVGGSACVRIEQTEDFHDWTPVREVQADAEGVVRWEDPLAGSTKGRWFRALTIPCEAIDSADSRGIRQSETDPVGLVFQEPPHATRLMGYSADLGNSWPTRQ